MVAGIRCAARCGRDDDRIGGRCCCRDGLRCRELPLEQCQIGCCQGIAAVEICGIGIDTVRRFRQQIVQQRGDILPVGAAAVIGVTNRKSADGAALLCNDDLIGEEIRLGILGLDIEHGIFCICGDRVGGIGELCPHSGCGIALRDAVIGFRSAEREPAAAVCAVL